MAMVGPSETGANNVEYDLISTLYHELQGNETLTRYEQDAREAGDHDVAQFCSPSGRACGGWPAG